MTISDSSHPITCATEPARVRVLFEGHEIADSGDVLVLQEANYPAVRYFPRSDVAMAFLRKSDKTSHCPHKGEASYYTIVRDRQIIENAVWSYESPFPALSRIAGRLAFYPQHVDFQVGTLSPAETAASDIDEVVRHTDSGSGTSQAEHWPPNVSMPDDAAWEGDEIKDGVVVGRPYQGTGSI
jgi:uncharacterized protein (DUF427 family)